MTSHNRVFAVATLQLIPARFAGRRCSGANDISNAPTDTSLKDYDMFR